MVNIGIQDLKTQTDKIIHSLQNQQIQYVIINQGQPVGLLLPINNLKSVNNSSNWSAPTDAWAELIRLGEEIATGWVSTQNSLEILADMRR